MFGNSHIGILPNITDQIKRQMAAPGCNHASSLAPQDGGHPIQGAGKKSSAKVCQYHIEVHLRHIYIHISIYLHIYVSLNRGRYWSSLRAPTVPLGRP